MSDTERYCPLATAGPFKACFVGADDAVKNMLLQVWGRDAAEWSFFSTGRDAAGTLLTSPPDLLVCCATLPDMSGLEVARLLKGENVYSQVPVILCFTEEEAAKDHNWADMEADDFFVVPCPLDLLRARLDMARNRAARTLDANPLTRLPGNTSIIRHTQGLIDQCRDFALAYCDLDFFKPFNDKYGFSRGDEVLMMASRIVLNTVHSLNLPFSFVGHVGGDDFVFIVPVEAAEGACKKVIAAFDGIVPNFYDEEDRQRGGIVSTDRQGVLRAFPLMAISIAVVFNREGSISHYGEASHLAMSLKKVAKENPLSSYVLDRRRPVVKTCK